MPTRNVQLTDHEESFVENLVASGRYADASEVLRAGLRLLEREASVDAEKLGVLRSLAKESFGSLDRGEGTSLEGNQQLADFIGEIGQRVVDRSASSRGT